MEILVRGQIHNTTLAGGVCLRDDWHVTASVKTVSLWSDEHWTLHGYIADKYSETLISVSSIAATPDSQVVRDKQIWPPKSALKKVHESETPSYRSLRDDIIMQA